MKKLLIPFLFLLFFAGTLQAASKKLVVKSPDGTLTIEAGLNDKDELIYQVKKNNQTVIYPSEMGIKGDLDFCSGLKIKSASKVMKLTETYNAPGEKRVNRTFAVNFAKMEIQNNADKILCVEFKATNEGVAFRYLIQTDEVVSVKGEKTAFHFDLNTRAWLHPHADAQTGWANTQPSYEEQYIYDMPVGTDSPLKAGWSFPALFKTPENWVLISEAGLTPDYVGTRLAQKSTNGIYHIEFPQLLETVQKTDPNYVISKQPVSPWRVIVIGTLNTVVESQMIADLAAPADKSIDYSWVKNGISSWSWGVLHDNATTYPVQKDFIDYAAAMHWEYCLIDADWDWKIGYDKIKELAEYAKTKNVGLILWYNSSGDWNTTKYSPKGVLIDKDARRAEFKKLMEMGIAGIKVDFWPGDGQSTIQLYYDMLSDAAAAHLLVNFHGTTVPRGWSRTFPNLLAMESIRGFEFTTFDQKDTDLAPKHLTMMTFARNIVGPMDFTPVCFGEIPGKKRQTSNAFEMALTIVLHSGIQHYVEIPSSMSKQPDFVRTYMQNVPRKWDDIKLVDGFPGKFAVIARKSGNNWYIGGINSQNSVQKIRIDFSLFKKSGLKEVTCFTDGNNNRTIINKIIPVSKNTVEIEMVSNGGFVMVF